MRLTVLYTRFAQEGIYGLFFLEESCIFTLKRLPTYENYTSSVDPDRLRNYVSW